MLHSHFSSGLPLKGRACLSIQVERKSNGWRTIEALFPDLPWFIWMRGESQLEGEMSRVSKMGPRTMLALFSEVKKKESLSSSTPNYPNVAAGECYDIGFSDSGDMSL